jgi:tetratricopeptide (TPR) repeat protein
LGKNEVNANKAKMNASTLYEIQKDIDEAFIECEELDNLSNSVIDLIDEDEAESVCSELSRRYPDQVDGIERLAMVCEARGDYEKAAEFYKKTAQFAQSKEGFDSEFVSWALEKAKALTT